MPTRIVVEISDAEQARLARELRRARWGGWLALHILLLLAQQRSPTAIAAWLFCSRTTVYTAAALWRAGRRPWQHAEDGVGAAAGLTSDRARSLRALLRQAPSALGWTRTRWSCATLAASLAARRGWAVSAETVRRWLHTLGWCWKRAKHVARNDDPDRAAKLARILFAFRHLHPRQALRFADEMDLSLLAKPGHQWMPRGEQVEVWTPGQNEKRHVAAAWDVRTGRVRHRVWCQKRTGLFLDLPDAVHQAYPARRWDKVTIVVDNYKVHTAKAVEKWLAAHPRVELLFLPTYCPQANPIERVFGDTHDKVTRNHWRKRIRDLVADVERHFARNGPWRYELGSVYETPDVQAEYRKLVQATAKAAA